MSSLNEQFSGRRHGRVEPELRINIWSSSACKRSSTERNETIVFVVVLWYILVGIYLWLTQVLLHIDRIPVHLNLKPQVFIKNKLIRVAYFVNE